MFKRMAILSLVALFVVPSVMADRRKYVWTYQYGTLAPGAAEIEFYQTSKLDDVDQWEYRIEIEHGLTEKADISVYQIFSQTEGESFKWDAVQVRGRYRLAEPGEFFMDPLFYLEYRRKIDLKKQNKVEAKLIFGKNIDKFNIAVNPVYEFFWAPGDPIHEIGLDVGISYEVSPILSIGLESTSRIEYIKDADTEKGSYFGPTISFAKGPIFYTLGYAPGLTDDSNDARVRFLMGIEL